MKTKLHVFKLNVVKELLALTDFDKNIQGKCIIYKIILYLLHIVRRVLYIFLTIFNITVTMQSRSPKWG
jgi:hypothetical protein